MAHAARLVHRGALLDAGRGNPNWVATAPREAFFALGTFALEEARRSWAGDGIAGLPQEDGIAARFDAWCLTHAATPGIASLVDLVAYGARRGFDRDAFVYELTDGIMGDHYPGPDRMLVHAERVVHDYLVAEMCAGCEPAVPFDLFAVEGGTAAMCYVFDSLAANFLLRPGDRVALM